MLNPLAHDFTPISSFPIEPSSTPTQKTKKKKQSEAKPKSKKNPPPLIKAETSTKPQKNKESRANNKKDPHHARVTHNNKAKQKSTQPIQPNLGDMFEKESKFITIEAAIDPIHRTDPASLNTIHTNKTISSDKQSVLEHGYERYLDWIDRSLRAFDTVTVVGMENAVVDVVSMVTILQDRKIAAHDDVETFSMNIGHNRIAACIQVKLHSYY